MIVEEVHADKCIHSGHLRVMAEVRKTYWILGLRQIAKGVGFKCVVCRRWRSRNIEQRMADLPSLRLCVGLPFENTAVDYFGPFETRYGGRARKNAYGAVFTCLTTRAVHVELVSDLTADRFLLALRRIMSIYGTPKKLRSDNGSNFVGAAREITRMLNSWRRNAKTSSPVLDFCEANLIEWSFSTPLAGHHNGAVESMVKSVKTALNKVVKGRVLWDEDYRTIFAEITACINSRPLWPSTDGDIDCPPITCEDMLRPTGLPRDPEELNVTCDPRKRYHQIQDIVNQWWRLWMLYFAPNLQSRSKWNKIRENVKVGDVVLSIDPDAPRSKWKMGIVNEVYPGSDLRK